MFILLSPERLPTPSSFFRKSRKIEADCKKKEHKVDVKGRVIFQSNDNGKTYFHLNKKGSIKIA